MLRFFPKIFLLVFIFGIVATAYYGELSEFLTFDYLKGHRADLQHYYAQNAWVAVAFYMAVYILVAALSLPGAAILTLAGGVLFGVLWGIVIASLASTIGATLAFFLSRFLLREWVQQKLQKKWGDKIERINRGIEKDGAFYLLTLRLVPLFPFFLVNLAMGLTRIPVRTYFFVSQIGMLLGTAIFVNAGAQLSRVDSLEDIFSLKLFLSFTALGVLPLVAKKIISFLKSRRIYRPYQKPKFFDYNTVVIGGGAAGLVTAYIGATLKAKVALIEKHKMGGDCLNTGCVPSKALIKSASLFSLAKNSAQYGIKRMSVEFDFADIMQRVKRIIKTVEPHDSIERYESLGVDCIHGKATLISPWEVEVGGKKISARQIILATGAKPHVPPIPNLAQIDYLTSDTLWNLSELPKRFLILGGGSIGMEMAQAFCRLGSEVTVVQRGQRILPREGPDVSREIVQQLESEGVKILTRHVPREFQDKALIADCDGREVRIAFDKVLLAVGRRPNVKGYGLEKLGVNLCPRGFIETNAYLQTNYPNIWACGDVCGPFQLTHAAAHQAWFCAVNALFGGWKKFKVDYSTLPWATYTDPEVATVGLGEEACRQKKISYEVTKYHLDDLDRAIADDQRRGFVKVLTRPKSDKIIGATIVGQHASDLLLEFVAAMKHGFGLNAILSTVHAYPTMGEANKYLAGTWRKARTPQRLLALLQKYHQWRRGA